MPVGDPPLKLSDLHKLPISRVRKVAPQALPGLAEMGIHTVLDLLRHYPRRYLDLTRRINMSEVDLASNENVYVAGYVVRVNRRVTSRQKRPIVTIKLRDATGYVDLVFFNQSWIADKYRAGDTVVAFGKVTSYRGQLQMSSPTIDRSGDLAGRLMPIYPQSGKSGVRSWDIARLVGCVLDLCKPRGIADPVPGEVLHRYRLVGREQAFNWMHRPSSKKDWVRANRRLVFDELLRVQLELVRRKQQMRTQTAAISHAVDGDLTEQFYSSLPFDLTGAQSRVIAEIASDLSATWPMHRLLQGDVGSGKTVVALTALLTAVQGGFQGVLMAPTEVLAEQHFTTMRSMLREIYIPDKSKLTGKRPLKVELLTGRRKVSHRRTVLWELASGAIDIAVGTHALISENVEYRSLAVAVIDEQHRFGVEQRSQLRDKGLHGRVMPDTLVMTATPIPRTAAMTVYGDLDVSVLDELPAGRTPIVTKRAQTPIQEEEVWQAVRDAVSRNRQAYVVCPLIEHSPVLSARSANEIYERLTSASNSLADASNSGDRRQGDRRQGSLDGQLQDVRVGLMHGRLASAEKATVMDKFRSGCVDVLVCTTVIEVGVDVPNATVMVIIDAHRFGIAQLHQLRGRIGRGSHASVCYIIGEATTKEGEARLEAFVSTTDGFKLAEIDLDLRGEGTIMGSHQKGRNDLRLASLSKHRNTVKKARIVADELVDSKGVLKHAPLAEEVDFMFCDDASVDFLFKN